MTSRIGAMLFLVALGAAPACAASPADVRAPAVTPAMAADPPADEAACTAAGGRWMKAGVRQLYRCVRSYPDGGKPCTASSECAGACVASAPTASPACQRDDNPYGCFATIEDIKAGKPVLCRD